MAMVFLLIALGSHGDVHPFIGIGRALLARGHRVRVAANEIFGDTIRSAGLEFVQVGTREDFAAIMNDAQVWHQRNGPRRIMQFVGDSLRQVYDTVRENASLETRLVGSSLAMGALCAAEAHDYWMATIHLAPLCIRSSQRMPVLPGGINTNYIPRFMRKGFWNGADKWFIDPMICPALNAFRAEISLPPVSKPYATWWHAPKLTIGLWPEWFFPRQDDYPQQVRLGGFVQYDESDHLSLDADLENWIEAGDAPIAFTPGSAMVFGQDFFRTAVDACVRLNCRGILLTRHAHQIPSNLPDNVRHVPFAPFGLLLPKCAALVHHGGIGTTAQGLRAGVPMLIMPMSHDQFDNAEICRQLGVADWLRVNRFTSRRVASRLEKLLTSPNVMNACQRVSAMAKNDEALDRICELLEQNARA